MLSVSMLSTGARAVASCLIASPECNPCRVRDETSTWYRYDPYMSRVMPSPMKTQMISPVKNHSHVQDPQQGQASKTLITGPAACDSAEFTENGLHRNSLFNTPPRSANVPQQFQQYQPEQQKPGSFLAAAEKKQPTTKTAESSKTHYAVVYFKHDSATFTAPFRISNGDHVIVEGDRGVDIGVVGDITTVTPRYPVPLKIVRRATSTDMDCFHEKQQKEQIVQQQVQTIAQSLNLGVQIVDTEFQFDNNKLTVFFEGRKQIDFRQLQRGLFREHRCRIWLSNMNEVEYNAKLQRTRRTR